VLRYPDFHRRQMVEVCEAGIRRAIEEDAQIIVDSDVVRQELLAEFSLTDSKITTVPLAPDERCRPRSEAECLSTLRRFDLSYGGFFLCVGTVEPRKNLSRVFEAYRVGREQKLFNWPLVVVGGRGWKSASEHEALEHLCDRGWARYLHYLDDCTLHDLYAATGLLVFPSLYEGFGLPAVEAAASGSRVLTSSGSAMADCLGDFATLVDPLDVEAIKTGLHESSVTDANQDPPKVVERTWQEVAIETAAVYRKALGDSPN
jgi:alpha-1,3-rhamnosyl/mannosyltransferase